MAQRIGAKGKPVGRPPVKAHAKAPIDEFFHAVHSQKNPIKGVTVKAPKAPRVKKAKVGPYTKPVAYKAGVKYRKGQPVTIGDQTILAGTPQRGAPKVGRVRATQLTKPVHPTLKTTQRDAEKLAGLTHSQGQALRKRSYAESHTDLFPSHANVVAASQELLGPTLTAAIGQHSFAPIAHDPLGAGLELAGLLPAGRIGRLADIGAGVVAHGPAERAIRIGAERVTGPAYRGLAGRGAQRAVDKATQRAINKAGGGMSGLANAPRFARANVKNLVKTHEFYRDIVERAPQEALAHTKVSAAKQMALRMVAHETPPDVWIANNNRIISAGATAKTVKNLRKENALINEARRYIRVVKAGKAGERFPTRLAAHQDTVVLSGHAPRDLHHAWGELLHTSRQMGEQGKALGRLSGESELERLSAPGRFHRGARWDAKEGRLAGAEDFHGGRVYMPSTRGRKMPFGGQYKPSAADALAATVKGGNEFRHPYRGILPLLGEESHNITAATGRAALGRQRLYQGVRKLEHLQQIAVKPEDLTARDLSLSDKAFLKRWQPIKRVAQLSDRTKADLDKALGKVDQGLHLTRSEENSLQKTLGDAYEEIIQHVTSLKDLNPDEVGFVPKAYIGDVHQYDPISRFDKMWGAFSDPLKKAIVYTKVGHAGPRLVSNLFFNLGQQGALLVPTAARTFILSKAAPDVMRWADALMGEGAYGAISEGLHDITTRALVTPVRKIADLMPRRFAFVYEAQKAYGRPFRSVQEATQYLNGLRTAPVGSEGHKTLIAVTQRARVAAGEYQRMSNFEKRKVSKFLFLYAWHRTAAVSTAKFALEHPVQAGAAAAGTYYLTNEVNKDAPPWEKFAVPLGGGTISNLSTSLPFSTPVEDAMKLKATGQHVLGLGATPPLGEALVGELNPSLLLPYMALSGRDPETGNQLKTNPLQEFSKQTPIGALVSGKRTWDERIGKYLVGNPYPTTSSTQLGAGGGTGPAVLSHSRRSITPAQHARILRLMRQAQRNARRAAARARKRQAKARR